MTASDWVGTKNNCKT